MTNFLKKFNWKYLIPFVVFYFASQNIGAFFGKNKAEKEIDDQRNNLILDVENYSKKLPRRIDNSTTQISIDYNRQTKTITYKNTLSDSAVVQISQLVTEEIKKAFTDNLKGDVCPNLLSKFPYVLHNVESTYFSKNNIAIFNIKININDCNKS